VDPAAALIDSSDSFQADFVAGGNGFVETGGLIPNLADQNSCAHWRSPMDMIFQGRSTSVFQA
jgi:hypothetical protein